MMRILLVNYEYPPLGGGGGVLTRTLAVELGRRHDVTVLTSRAGDLHADSYDGDVRLVRVPVVGRRDPSKASLPSLLSFVPAARRRGARLVDGRPFDLVHSFFAVPTGPAGAWLARRAGTPHVLTLIGADIYDPSRLDPQRFAPLRITVRRLIRDADALTAISRDIAARARLLSGRDDIEVVPCGIPHPPLPQPDRPGLGWGEEFVVLTIARLVRRKALDTLIEATTRVPGIRLEIVGDGPERDALKRAAGPQVTFAGPLSREDVLARLVSADAFALVSLHEGFGLVYLEAMRAGLPVVAGTIGGQTDFLADGENALLVPPGDPDATAAALARIATDRELRRRLAGAGLETAKDYTSVAMAAAYEDVYRRVLLAGELVP